MTKAETPPRADSRMVPRLLHHDMLGINEGTARKLGGSF
jgi:hypothetical protein